MALSQVFIVEPVKALLDFVGDLSKRTLEILRQHAPVECFEVIVAMRKLQKSYFKDGQKQTWNDVFKFVRDFCLDRDAHDRTKASLKGFDVERQTMRREVSA